MLPIIKMLYALFNFIKGAMKKKRQDEIKADPLSAFDSQFGGVRDNATVQQADPKPTTERQHVNSESS